MAVDNALIEIIRICMWTASRASAIYDRLEQEEQDEQLSQFWHSMADDEKTHLLYWGYILILTEEGSMPVIFDDSETLASELKAVKTKLETLVHRFEKNPTVMNGFLIACRLEFSMPYHTLIELFRYVQSVSEELTPEDDYNRHLRKLIDTMGRYSKTPELDLVGDIITRYLQEQNALVEETNHDFLTGILNRRGFFRTITPLAHLAERNRYTVGVLMIDIDNFKKVNDEFGHPVGDQLIRFVSGIITESVRKSDVVGRYGGEEFIVYLSSVEPKHLTTICERIRHSVDEDSARIAPVTVSVGVSYTQFTTKNPRREIEVLIEQADIALYKAKRSGKNKVVIEAPVRVQAQA